MASERTFDELLKAYRKTAIEQSKCTDPGALLCGGDILDDLADEIRAAARADGAAAERERIVRGSQRFPQGSYIADSEYVSVVYDRGEPETLTDCELFVTPASLLAPDKENEK